MSTVVSLKHTCTLCYRSFTDAAKVRRHLLQQHQRSLPSIPNGLRRHNNDEFIYVKHLGDGEHPSIVTQFACPSCLHHFPDISAFDGHIDQIHISRKRPAPDIEEQSADGVTDIEGILIPTSQDVLTFSLLSSSASASNRPKLQSDIARSLASLVTFVAQDKTSSLAALKSWKTAFAFTKEALTKPLSELPLWLWSYECPAGLDSFEAKLICVMQFVLTGFASKCGRENLGQFRTEVKIRGRYWVRWV